MLQGKEAGQQRHGIPANAHQGWAGIRQELERRLGALGKALSSPLDRHRGARINQIDKADGIDGELASPLAVASF